MISELIDSPDSFEVVRDQIAALLVAEVASQKALAMQAGRDPNEWDLRVFVERSNPWAEFIDAPAQASATPIVNISFDNSSFDMTRGTVAARQMSSATYHIDCYGYGISEDDGEDGHVVGDERAALEAQRAIRLVRKILMAATYTYLGLQGVVGRRWVQSVTMFQPAIDGRSVQQIVAGRIALQTELLATAPQVEGAPLEVLSINVLRRETGEVYLAAQFGEEADDDS